MVRLGVLTQKREKEKEKEREREREDSQCECGNDCQQVIYVVDMPSFCAEYLPVELWHSFPSLQSGSLSRSVVLKSKISLFMSTLNEQCC